MRLMVVPATVLGMITLPIIARPMMVTPGPNAPRGVFTRVGPSVKAHKVGDGLAFRGRLLASECKPPAGWCKVILADGATAFASAEYLTIVGDSFEFKVTFLDTDGG